MYNKLRLIMLIGAGFLQASCMYPRRDLPTIAIDWSAVRTYDDLVNFLANKNGVLTQFIDLIEPASNQIFLSAKKDPAYAFSGLVKKNEFNK